MPAAICVDTRRRVLDAYHRGFKTAQIGRMFGISRACCRRIKQQWREEGRCEPKSGGGARVVKIDQDKLAQSVQAYPDATLEQRRALLGFDCGITAMHKALRKLGFTFKKNGAGQRAKTAARPGAAR